jgi:hypothetical protein
VLRRAWLDSLDWNSAGTGDAARGFMPAIDRLADHVEAALDMDRLRAMIYG